MGLGYSYTDEKTEKMKAEMDDRRSAVIDAISKRLAELGHTVSSDLGRIDDEFTSFGIQYEVDRTRSSTWSYRYTGKLRMKIGSYGECRNYAEPKNGFDIEKSVQRLLDYVESCKGKRKIRENRDELFRVGQAFFEKTCEEMGEKNAFHSVRFGKVKVERGNGKQVKIVEAYVTPDQLKKIMTILEEDE